MAKVLRSELPNEIKSIINKNFIVTGSPGKGNWTNLPWIGIFNPEITSSAQSGYYIVYLFTEDMKGVYLSLNQGVTNIRNKYGNKKAKEYLLNSSESFRKIILEINRSHELITDISLGTGNFAPFYEAGNIYSKYYSAEDLTSEDIMVNDLKEFLDLYEIIYQKNNKLVVVEDETEISQAQSIFEDQIKNLANKTITARAGFQGGQEEGTMYWSNDLGIWFQSRKIEDSRYWNGFGLEEPEEGKGYTILCEINFPINGIRRAVAGAIAKDSNNDYYILHRGKLGGNFSKKIFDEKYKGDWTLVQDGDRETEMVLIGKLNDPKLPYNVRDFVKEINKIKYGDDEIPEKETGDIIGTGINSSFYDYLIKEGYFFDRKTIENYLLSVKVKPFVILTGNSGTGKTKLAQLFAQFVSEKQETAQTQYKIVPVGANWTENRHIVGFYNVISDQYQETPAFELIKESEKPENKEIPHFLILDEMNLSHVERYFADFLSALESGESIPLYTEKKDLESELNIPKNLLVIGTVNVDETTYMFSPKVLDRTNTIEFSTYSAKNYMNNEFNLNAPRGNLEYLENPLLDSGIRELNINDLRKKLEKVSTISGQKMWDILSNELDSFQDILKEAGFDFGFRVINEILRFMCVAWTYEGKPETWNNWERYFDAQIKQKMLPKIHGSERAIGNVLLELFNQCLSIDSEKSPRFYDLSNLDIKFISSAIKLQEMDKVLAEQRYVSFIN